MATLGVATLETAAEMGGLNRDLGKAEGDTKGWLGKLGDTFKSGMGAALGMAVYDMAKGLVTGAFNLIKDGLASVIAEASEAELVQAQLNATLKSTGGIAGVTAEMATNLADSLAGMTRFGDEAILSGENILLTFTNIGSDVFPMATETMLDMSQALGQDLKSSAIQLGKALQDPIAGVSALSRVGVNFTEEQKKMIEAMVEAGDTAGAQAFILKELQTEFGGSAKAAGETFAGRLDILKNRISNVKEGIGMALMPALTMLMDQVITPALPIIEQLGQKLVGAISVAVAWWVNEGQPIFQQVWDWLAVNIPAAIEVLRAFWEGTLAPALMNFFAWVQANVFPALATLFTWLSANIPTAIQALSDFWTTTLQPALMTFFAWVQANVFPALANLAAWLGTYIPPIIQALANYWTTVMWPALQQVFAWIVANVFPILAQVVTWLAVNIPVAIQLASSFWTNTLQPALQQVWNFIQNNVLPVLADVVVWLSENVPVAIQMASDFWTNTLQPALSKAWAYISENVLPVLAQIVTWLGENIPVAIQKASDFWTNTLQPALSDLWKFISESLWPVMVDIATWLGTTIGTVIGTAAAFWKDTLQPALAGVWKFLSEDLLPIFVAVGDFLSGTFQGVLDGIKGAFDAIGDVVQWIIDRFNDLVQALEDIGESIPDWLIPGSPTPLEMGLRGIGRAVTDLARKEMPRLQAGLQMELQPMMAGYGESGGGKSVTNYWQLSANYRNAEDEGSLGDTVRMLSLMYGGAG